MLLFLGENPMTQNSFRNLGKKIVGALMSEYLFVWLAGAVIFTFWALNLWTVGVLVVCVMIAFSLVLFKDTARVLAILYMIVLIISENSHELAGFGWLLIASITLLVAGIIVHIIRFKVSFKPMFSQFKVKGFSVSLVLLAIPAALGGITRGERNVVAALVGFGFFALVGICYLFFLATTEDKKGDDMLRYVLTMMLVAGLVMSAQLITYYVRLGSVENVLANIRLKNIRLGWASANNVAPFLSMTWPCLFYFATKKKHYGFLFIILAFIEYLLIFTTKCRGAILFTTLAFPFLLCYTMAKSENKVANGFTISLLSAGIVIFAALKAEKVLPAFESMFELGLSENGRIPLYLEALEVFRKYPVFGAGWDYRLGELAGDSYTPYWFHDTVLQIMANMGIVGLIFYLPFFGWRYGSCLLTKNYRMPKLAVAAGMILFELYGLVDVNFFGPTFFISMVIMSLAVEKSLEKDQCNPLLFLDLSAKAASRKNLKAFR